jgi:hypothetical protein
MERDVTTLMKEDLHELGAVRNPYLRRGIEESRALVYAA